MTGKASPVDLRLGSPDSNHLTLRPLRRAHPASEDYWEANWLKVDVTVRAGAFSGAFEADLRSDEFEDLADQLEALQRTPGGTARLESAEGWVAVRLTQDARGGLRGACEVRDDPAMGNSLRFSVDAGPAQLGELLLAVRALLSAYPVVGSREAETDALLGPAGEPEEG